MLYTFWAAIRLDVYLQSPWWLIHNVWLVPHGPSLCVVYMKNASYKTNQTDSLQMETKVQSQLRSDLIYCLSSESMWSHPEIPHKPHLLSIWPCSHAIQCCAAARPVLQTQQDSAPEHFYQENKSGWGRNKGHVGWDWWRGCMGGKRSGNDNTDAIISYWFVVSLYCIALQSKITSRWWFTWWYLIACWSHDLQDAQWCSYQNWETTLHSPCPPPCRHQSPHIQVENTWSSGCCLSLCLYVHKWIQVLTTQSVYLL